MSWIASDLTDTPTAARRDPYNPFRTGERLAGKYEVIEPLGGGGVGFVFAARHVGFDSQVALKFLYPEYASEPEIVERFVREARAGFRIDNKHVARTIDLEELADGTPFIVMEHLHGSDLRRVLDHAGKLPAQRACQYALQACNGLQAAHALGVIHRDIKPENLFLVSGDPQRELNEHIKVLDFGISKLSPTALIRSSHKATTQVAIGTPQYMSPEQVRGTADLDARTDIWSLGCVLYELLTGVAPFGRSSVAQSCAAVLEDKPLPPNALVPELPPGLSALVLSCLHKDRARRPQTAEALAAMLTRFASLAPTPIAASFDTGSVRVPRSRLGPGTWTLAAFIALGMLTAVWWTAPASRTPRLIASLEATQATEATIPHPSSAMPDEAIRDEPASAPTAATSAPERAARSPVKLRRSKPQPQPAPEKPAPRPDPDVGF